MKLVLVLVGNTACVVPVCLSFSFLSVLLYCVVIGQFCHALSPSE